MIRKIGIETSSIMPLLEITPRTLPLQKTIKEAISRCDIEFYTDFYSVKEANQLSGFASVKYSTIAPVVHYYRL